MEGYKKLAYQMGYESACAVPWTEDLVATVIESLVARSAAFQHGNDRELAISAVAARDAAGLALAWETTLRGKEVCCLLSSDFYLPGLDCQPAWDQICAGQFSAATVVLVEPGLGTKVDSSSTPGVVRLRYHPDRICALVQLHLLARRLKAMGADTSGFILRPLNADLVSFKSSALGSDVLNRQLQDALRRLGLWAGHTTHGVKRGKLQAELHDGATAAEISAGRHADEGMTARYLHPTAHKRRLRAMSQDDPTA